MPERAVLELAGAPDDGALAIAFNRGGLAAERGDKIARHRETERLEVLHEEGDLLHIASGEGIADHG